MRWKGGVAVKRSRVTGTVSGDNAADGRGIRRDGNSVADNADRDSERPEYFPQEHIFNQLACSCELSIAD